MTGAVSVIVPVHNRLDLVLRCLDSVPDSAEVVVVDDASTEPVLAEVGRARPTAHLLRNDTNLGFAGTANRGLAAARGGVLVVLNSDARLRPGALDALTKAFEDPQVGIAGARLVFPDGTHQTSAAAFPTPASTVTGSFLLNEIARRLRPGRRFRYELGLSRADHASSRDVDWVHGTCLAIRAECLAAVGGFDPGFRFYGEETDLCWRARAAGWRVRYVADAVVEHEGGGSSGSESRRARVAIASEARFMAKAYGAAALPRWRVARLVGGALKVLVLALPALVSGRVRARWRWQLAATLTVAGGGWRADLPS